MVFNLFKFLVLLLCSANLSAYTLKHLHLKPEVFSFFTSSQAALNTYDGTNQTINTFDDLTAAYQGYNAFLYGGAAGFETQHQTLYLSFVGNALYHALSQDERVHYSLPHLLSRNEFQYGASMRLGTTYKHITPFISGGFEAGRWQTHIAPTAAYKMQSHHQNTTLLGPQAGFGFLIRQAKLRLGLEVAHTGFGSMHQTLIDAKSQQAISHKADVAQNQLLLSIQYVFDAS